MKKEVKQSRKAARKAGKQFGEIYIGKRENVSKDVAKSFGTHVYPKSGQKVDSVNGHPLYKQLKDIEVYSDGSRRANFQPTKLGKIYANSERRVLRKHYGKVLGEKKYTGKA